MSRTCANCCRLLLQRMNLDPHTTNTVAAAQRLLKTERFRFVLNGHAVAAMATD